jgi:hypothetical protein
MSNPERNSELRDYRVVAFISDIFVMSVVPMLLGAVVALPAGRPVYEGLAFGLICGFTLTVASLFNSEIREQWAKDTEDGFDEAQRQDDMEWEKEKKRPDDEYVGW